MTQPPGIRISPIADMEVHQSTVTIAHTAKSSPEMAKKARRGASSDTAEAPIPREMVHSNGLMMDVALFMLLSPMLSRALAGFQY
jgi:hypothetical protein